MSNPSLIWGQLSMPNPPAGSIPFVAADNASIITDVLNFKYDLTNKRLTVAGGLVVGFTDTSVSPGGATANTISGRSSIGAGQSSIVIANSLVALGDIVNVTLETADATLIRIVAITGVGSITITGNAAATATSVLSWLITKTSVGIPA